MFYSDTENFSNNMQSFILRPWEFLGAPINEATHAQIAAEIGGRNRHFLLKMHQGVIYFREQVNSRNGAQNPPIYAVTRIFEDEMDSEKLIACWRAEMERENYGRFVSRVRRFSSLAGQAILCIIHRRDRSGWIKENSDCDWLKFDSNARQKPLDLWAPRLFLHYANRRAAQLAHKTMVNRTLPPQNRMDWPVRWLNGSPDELRPLLLAVLQLWAPQIGEHYDDEDSILLQWCACGPHSLGGARLCCDFDLPNFQFSISARAILRLLWDDFTFQGLVWRNDLENPVDNRTYIDEDLMKAGNRTFGEDWRGNWWPETPFESFDFAPFSTPTAHERLEAALVVRPWLSKKLTPQRARKLIDNALSRFY